MLDQTIDLSNLTTKLAAFMTEENAKRVQLHLRLFKKLLLKYAILRSEIKTILDDISDKASIIDAFFKFAQAEQKREVNELIKSEGLNVEEAKRYISTSLKREYASENGTELNSTLPKMSPLNPQFKTKKQTVFQKIAAFVEKFKGVGGKV